ncbi:hypothetical protein J6590_103379, partial [Homalodisca vitripennis]
GGDLKEYSRKNCVKRQGIPEANNESVVQIVKDVGKALHVNIANEIIDVCHRVGSKDHPSRPLGIIVKFVRRTDKELLINKRREKRQDISTRHIGLVVNKPTFVNESLSPARRRLPGQAQEVKKIRNIKSISVA